MPEVLGCSTRSDVYNQLGSSMKNHITLVIMLLSIVLLTAACGDEIGPEERPTSGFSPQATADLDFRVATTAESILQAINVQRAEQGVPALISQPVLVDLALSRSTDLAVRSYLGHEDPETGDVNIETALAQLGYSGPAAELVFASGHPLENVPERVATAWFRDPMHKALLLEPSFMYGGIGIMGDGESWKITMVLTVDLPQEALP